MRKHKNKRVSLLTRVDTETATRVKAAVEKLSRETGFSVSVSDWLAMQIRKALAE